MTRTLGLFCSLYSKCPPEAGMYLLFAGSKQSKPCRCGDVIAIAKRINIGGTCNTTSESRRS